MTAVSIHQAIANRFGDLSPQLQKAARFVSENPDEIATRTLRQVARHADLSPPTLSRLARAIGCDSYDELRELCRSDISRRKSRLAEKALALLEDRKDEDAAKSESLLMQQSVASISNIQALLETIDQVTLDRTVKILAASNRVTLIGMMSSHPFVNYLGYLAGMVSPNWRVAGENGFSLAMAIGDLRQGDCVLALSFEPYSARTLGAARSARAQGARVVGITDWPSSPLIECADPLFLIPTSSPQFFPSHVALLVLLEAMVGMVVRKKGQSAQERIAAIERQNHAMGEYWQVRSAQDEP